jgi:hypothetical protein
MVKKHLKKNINLGRKQRSITYREIHFPIFLVDKVLKKNPIELNLRVNMFCE